MLHVQEPNEINLRLEIRYFELYRGYLVGTQALCVTFVSLGELPKNIKKGI